MRLGLQTKGIKNAVDICDLTASHSGTHTHTHTHTSTHTQTHTHRERGIKRERPTDMYSEYIQDCFYCLSIMLIVSYRN